MYNFRVKRCTEVPADSVFSGPITHLLSMLRVLTKILSQARAKKKTKGFKVSNFAHYWLFSSSIMPVKGLSIAFTYLLPAHRLSSSPGVVRFSYPSTMMLCRLKKKNFFLLKLIQPTMQCLHNSKLLPSVAVRLARSEVTNTCSVRDRCTTEAGCHCRQRRARCGYVCVCLCARARVSVCVCVCVPAVCVCVCV